MSHRSEQIENLIKRIVSKLIATQISDPRIRGLISVTSVKVTSDLKKADVNISVIPEEHQKLTVHGLNSASGYIHTRLLKEMTLRRVPHLKFHSDEVLKRTAKIYDAIRNGLDKNEALGSSDQSQLPDENNQATSDSKNSQHKTEE